MNTEFNFAQSKLTRSRIIYSLLVCFLVTLAQMEFPITRERLQNYRVTDALSADIKKGVLEEIQKICAGVEEVVLTTD